ncbi:MAG TPA: ABC transporter permease [Acidimicrobiia bacterium]|nr:ABC transporter permease [Acidimicrobiia bacterium]
MGRYVARRLLQMILVLFGASLILFVALFVLPGDPIGTAGGERARDPAVRAVLEKRYGLDKPLPVQYVRYVGRVLQGDFGESYRLRRPVSEILRSRFGATAQLALAAIAIEILIGIVAGVIAAVFRYSFWDVLVTLTTTMVIGIPTYVGGSILQGIFAQNFDWFPRGGRGDGGLDTLRHLVLPALTLASVDAALVARLMRGTMLEVLRADYVRTALAKGLSKRTVILKHVMRNSVIPVVTYVGIAFGGLMGGALITEVIFNWPGIGEALSTAITAQDNPIIIAVVTYGVTAFVIVNLIVDLTYAYLDPRIRLE